MKKPDSETKEAEESDSEKEESDSEKKKAEELDHEKKKERPYLIFERDNYLVPDFTPRS